MNRPCAYNKQFVHIKINSPFPSSVVNVVAIVRVRVTVRVRVRIRVRFLSLMLTLMPRIYAA